MAQQQINIVKSQIAVKQRDMRLHQLTSSEISSLPPTTNVYEGVGKMYVLSLLLPCISVVMSGASVGDVPGRGRGW
jgi:hypothetical protein